MCLDSSSCNVFAGNKCDLYSFDPANGCRRSAGPVGQRNQDGCFDPDAKITMADGSKRAIKFIRAGDKVFNPMTKKSMTVETVIKGPEKKPLYLVEHNKGATLVTSKHPFVLKSGLVVQANQQLKTGDFVQDVRGEWMSLTKVEKQVVKKGQEVWNFTFKTKSTNPETISS